MTNRVRVVLTHVAKPFTMNSSARSGAHWAHVKNTKEWRAAGLLLARHQHVPTLTAATVEVHSWQPRGRLADAGAILPSVKALIDGATDAGLFPDDNGKHVTTLIMHAPTRGAYTVQLTIIGEPFESAL